jgi:hypothetical protein
MKRILFCLLATLLTAQATPEVEITAEPHHHLTFENKSVRVFNVEVPPNEATEIHWHRHDYIAITLGAAEIVNTVKDKPPVTVKFADGDTRFAAATFAHFVRTTSPEPFRNVTIELLEDATLRNATSPWDPAKNEDRGLVTFSGGTKQILFVKDAIRVSEIELQPGAKAPMPASACLIVAVNDLKLQAADLPRNAPNNAWQSIRQESGGSEWLPGGYVHAVTNIGTKAAKFVTLEFP